MPYLYLHRGRVFLIARLPSAFLLRLSGRAIHSMPSLSDILKAVSLTDVTTAVATSLLGILPTSSFLFMYCPYVQGMYAMSVVSTYDRVNAAPPES